ncbi:MAG TPA: aldose 1-epimerase family protein [Chthoniobacterales bacterium]|nr:aldose 1-epimerase family protein [Chthoniobacterales bacterium]
MKKVITDVANGISVKEWTLNPREIGDTSGNWSVRKATLSGGRQEGTEVIYVDNGLLRFSVVPSRGFNIWEGQVGNIRLGWDSPIREIVHPQFINLADKGGLGWLAGFGEFISRCGLESMGAPCVDGNTPLGLHGRINYLPASLVEVHFEDTPAPRFVLRGVIDESVMFGPHLRLTAEISTQIGTPEITLNDSITNLGDSPQEFQTLYHINFGPPLLGAGSQFIAPIKHVAPRDKRAAEGLASWNQYTGPHAPGYTEQVYLMELWDDQEGQTEALLKSPGGQLGASVFYGTKGLPYFTLWKNEAPLRNGYVTGLEPASSYPCPRPFERSAGRLPILKGGESYQSRVAIRVLRNAGEVEEAEKRIANLQREAVQIRPETVL